MARAKARCFLACVHRAFQIYYSARSILTQSNVSGLAGFSVDDDVLELAMQWVILPVTLLGIHTSLHHTMADLMGETERLRDSVRPSVDAQVGISWQLWQASCRSLDHKMADLLGETERPRDSVHIVVLLLSCLVFQGHAMQCSTQQAA